ncbi:MAG: UDP-N-acetylmuramoyl-L-alanine--D-glutamate ligase [Acidobacteriota bacterium]|nr:UDP-N-acetylmuramoyl-L-alanine--D-glutamate ligase [Acidobacteriota bacterium]
MAGLSPDGTACGGVALGDVCVLGLGRTGEAVASYLADRIGGRVSSVTLYGGARSDAGPASRALEERGVRVVLGTEEVTGSYDLAVASPGIPEGSPFLRAAAACSREVIGEPELAWRESPGRWLAITGTNGKTTTTALATALLRAGGEDAVAVGNIGTLAIGEVAARPAPRWFVAELSSFQLAESVRLHPRVAVLLNVTPDHLSWHGGIERYAEAKECVFANLDAHDLAVVSCEDDWCRAAIGRLEDRGLRVAHLCATCDPGTPCAAFVRDDRLVVRLDGTEHELAAVDEMAIRGSHNVQNALAASALALEVGAPADLVRAGLLAFAPLEHRIEPCGEAGGVRFVNDSKATNTDAVEKALTAFDPRRLILLMGGHDKGTDLGSVARAASRGARVVICFGEAGERMAQAVEGAGGTSRVIRARHLAEAFQTACDVAARGDVVLLSPACSSFDEFSNFEERGRAFKRLVAEHASDGGGAR